MGADIKDSCGKQQEEKKRKREEKKGGKREESGNPIPPYREARYFFW